MAEILKQPLTQKTITIPAGSIDLIADSVALELLKCVEYDLCCESEDSTKVYSLKLRGRHDDNGVKETIYGKGGTRMDLAFNAVKTGSAFELQVSNGEAFDVNLTITRLLM